jgi:biopolymer transport protein ExbD
MSMSVGGSDDDVMIDINTTPLIDVMLVLLIYLIISLPPVTHAVKLDMPRPSNQPQTQQVDPVVIDLEVDFDGTYYWNGEAVSSFATLESYFKQAARQEPQPELHIKPNRSVRYDFVALALAAAQRNQIMRIGFVGQEQYAE